MCLSRLGSLVLFPRHRDLCIVWHEMDEWCRKIGHECLLIILKSQFTTKSTIQMDHSADFLGLLSGMLWIKNQTWQNFSENSSLANWLSKSTIVLTFENCRLEWYTWMMSRNWPWMPDNYSGKTVIYFKTLIGSWLLSR